jgi:regulator of sigma E protease
MSVLLLIVGVLLFISLVIVHEFGHFIMARRGGVEVEEFGIFFPPRLYKRRMKGGWDFTINLIPLGGFVKLKGEHDSDTEKGSFGAASLSRKAKIMVAGVVMNLITALVLFTIVAFIGMPKLVENQFTVKSDTHLISQQVLVTYIEPGSPASHAGLKADDQLLSLQQHGYSPVTITSSKELLAVTKAFAGKTAMLIYKRAGTIQQSKVTFNSKAVVDASQKTNNPKGYLGIGPTDFSLQRSTWSAPVVAVGLSAQLTALTFQGLGHALGGLGSIIAGAATGNSTARQHGQTSSSSQVSGPIGIYLILKAGSLLGYKFMLMIIAYISLTLAIMNILPIPALDGGRLWITLVARALKRPLNAKLEEKVNLIGFLVLISLIIVISIVDVRRFF